MPLIHRSASPTRDLASMMLSMSLRRAARHVPEVWRRIPSVVVFVAPEGMRTVYRDALYETYDIARHPRDTAVVSYEDAVEAKRLMDRERGGLVTRMAAVVDDESILPDGADLYVDAVVRVERPTREHIRAAALSVYGRRLVDSEVALIDRATIAQVRRAFRPGRPLARAIALLRSALEREDQQSAAQASPALPDGPTLDDLHGLGEAGDWGRDLARDLDDWRAGRITWAEVDRGILLSGPPGTGKTTFAAALARSCRAHFVAGSLARWQAHGHLGDLLRAMRRDFEEAKRHAPSILFVDELDSAGDRSQFSGDNRSYCVQVVNGLLEAIDGIDGREGVVIVGATNSPDDIDPAIRRPGRLDRHVRIPLPDADAREGILRYHLCGALPDADVSEVVALTDGSSGAALEQLVRTAKRSARRARRDVEVRDLLDALPERLVITDDQVRHLAVHEAGHAVIGHALGYDVESVKVERSCIKGGGTISGGATVFAESDRVLSTVTDLDRLMIRTLAAMAAEAEILGEVSSGAGGHEGTDLWHATVNAAAMEASYGMGDNIVMLTLAEAEDLMRLVRTDYEVRRRVERRLRDVMDRTRSMVRDHRSAIERVAEALVIHGNLDRRAFVDAIIGQSNRAWQRHPETIQIAEPYPAGGINAV